MAKTDQELLDSWSPQQKEFFIKWATSEITCPYCKAELGKPTEVNAMDALGDHLAETPACIQKLIDSTKR